MYILFVHKNFLCVRLQYKFKFKIKGEIGGGGTGSKVLSGLVALTQRFKLVVTVLYDSIHSWIGDSLT